MASFLANYLEEVMKNRRYQYWTLQTIGWTGYGSLAIVGAWLWEKDAAAYALYITVATILGLLVSMIMRECFHLIWDKPAISRGLLTLLTVIVATLFWAGWKCYVFYQIFEREEYSGFFMTVIAWIPISLYIYLCWTGLYYGIKYYQMMLEEREKNLRISSMAHEAQLKMLRYQLNPHFLFNTLNAISTLILENRGDIANKMVTKLSNFLRYSLENDPLHKVSLAQEVEAMRLYLDIEKVRFEERLQIEFELEDSARLALIPSMLLQPLVENAIKYAVAKSESGGRIHLAARVFAEELLLELSDDGPGIDLEDGHLPQDNGVGLTNTQERLSELYGSNYSCKFTNIEPHGLKISIRIPYETEVQGQQWKN